MTKGNMRSSPRFHGKSHNLSFHKDEQQDKHLEESQKLDNTQILFCVFVFLLYSSILNKTPEDNKQK